MSSYCNSCERELQMVDADVIRPNTVKKSRITTPIEKIIPARNGRGRRNTNGKRCFYRPTPKNPSDIGQSEKYDKIRTSDGIDQSVEELHKILDDNNSLPTNTTEQTDLLGLQRSSMNTEEERKQESPTLKSVHSTAEIINIKSGHELENSSGRSSVEVLEKELPKTYKVTADNISTAELLKPGKFVRNIAAITEEDVKIKISNIGVSTSSKQPEAHAMSYLQIMFGENTRKWQQSITIRSVLILGTTKEIHCKMSTTFHMDGSKDDYTFMTSLASINELTGIHESHLSINFEITIASL